MVVLVEDQLQMVAVAVVELADTMVQLVNQVEELLTEQVELVKQVKLMAQVMTNLYLLEALEDIKAEPQIGQEFSLLEQEQHLEQTQLEPLEVLAVAVEPGLSQEDLDKQVWW
jgi:transposase